MVWIKSLEGSYINVDNILSITFDKKCNSFVAVVGYKDSRLQHKIFQIRALENILAGYKPKSNNEIIEEMVTLIERSKSGEGEKILDFIHLLD
jgi:hypothetical protein